MSVRAYIVQEDFIYVDKKAKTFYNGKEYMRMDENKKKELIIYKHEDLIYCMNYWHQDNLRRLLIEYGAFDCTNNDCVGEMEIDIDLFKDLMDSIKINTFPKEDRESLKLIQNEFDKGALYVVLKSL